MLEKLEACPSCKATNFVTYLECQDFMVTQESFNLDQCQDCHLIFTNPRPTATSISKYYESTEYISHTNDTRTLKDLLYKTVRSYALGKKVKLISSLTKSRKLLDFGCGTGHFLNKASKNGWDIYGIEPSPNARDEINKNLQEKITADIKGLKDELKFDVITLWHVLEHVHTLRDTINSLKHRLTKTGKIIIAVPNPNSYDAQHYKEYWAAYDVPRHLYHFTQESMRTFLNTMGLKIDYIKPMQFDSYYVSLLSEKYKTNKTNYITSFINGYKSNGYANKTSEFSSLIYVISNK